MQTIELKFQPRPYQLKIIQALNSGTKRAAWCCHRRAGKDLTIFNWCVAKLLEKPATCFYVFPSYAQAKKVIWDAITIDGTKVLDYIPKEVVAARNNQEMKIRFTNGSLLQLVGSDNIDSLVGTNPYIVVFSEYAIQTPDSWNFLRPILLANKGYAIFISTPRGRNHFYDLCRVAETTEGWFYQRLTAKDTGVISEKDIEQERKEGMSEELIQQEYYCSFERGIEGSYYGKLINLMREQARICPVRYDPYLPVFTSWDLGWGDSTAIIFFQLVGTNVHIIDCEEHSTQTLAWYRDLLNSKPYKYRENLFPHDVEQHDGISTGCTRREILEALGVSVKAVPKLPVHDGIEAVRRLMSSRLFIDEAKCQPLLKAIESYHREWDDKHKVYSSKPRHDWSSHYSDSLRYLALGLPSLGGADEKDEDTFKAVRKYWG